MNCESVFALFQKLSGLSEDEGGAYRFLCEEAIAKVVSVSEHTRSCGGQRELAAAALAYYRYVLLTMSNSSAAVKVGEVSIRKSENCLRFAEKLYKDAMAQLDGYAGEDFVFEGV